MMNFLEIQQAVSYLTEDERGAITAFADEIGAVVTLCETGMIMSLAKD